MNYLSTNIKYLRQQKKLTQEDIAKVVGKVRSLISAWEADERDISVEDIIKLSEFFNVSMEELIGRDLRINNNNEVKKNEYNEQIKKLATENGVEIRIAQNKELTAEDVLLVNQLLMDELKNQKKE